MGCGSSKAVPVVANTAPKKVVVSAAPEEKPVKTVAVIEAKPINTSTPTKEDSSKDLIKSSPGDSGLDENGVITEDTVGGEEIAGKGRPITPELELAGTKPAVRATRQPDSDAEGDDMMNTSSTAHRDRDTSALSTRSAPIIMQRPSSRGGSAFDISFEEEPSTPGLPKRLVSRGDSSGRKKREEMTLEELQAKLQAADQRRRDIESRIKQKMHQESEKGESIRSTNNSLNASMDKSQTDEGEKEKQALNNREAHLRQLRERLRAKEERARQVREKKKLMAANGTAPPVAAL